MGGGEILGSYRPSYNLLAASQDLGGSPWSAVDDMDPPLLDVTLAPDFTFTADKIVDAALGGGSGAGNLNQAFPVRLGITYILSCFVHAAERDELQIGLDSAFPSNSEAGFDLSANPGITLGTGAILGSATKELVGSGWFRVSFAATAGDRKSVV